MGLVKNLLDEHENRVAAISVIGIEVQALILDKASDEVVSSGDAEADKLVYARAFQAWADGKISGTAEDIFDAIQEALEVE
jgi:hypothetical protein